MWVARDIDESIYLYKDKPIKDTEIGMWQPVNGLDFYELYADESWMFEDVKWEDKEPTEIKLIRK